MAKGPYPQEPYRFDSNRPRSLKKRLTTREFKLLQLFFKHSIDSESRAKSMLEMLELYKATYDEAVHPALISQALSQLRDSGFLSSQMGLPEMVSKLEHKVIYKKRKKMKDWLSPEALSGQLAVDNERWIKASEQYIADERTRARVKARERQK